MATQGKVLGVGVMDMQQSFVARLRESEAARIVRNQVRILQRCEQRGIPVVFIEYQGYGSTLAELTDAVPEGGYEKFVKAHDSAFRMRNGDWRPDFKELLDRKNIGTLFLMGINANACLWKTTEDTLDLDDLTCVTSMEAISAEGGSWRWTTRAFFGKRGLLVKNFRSLLAPSGAPAQEAIAA